MEEIRQRAKEERFDMVRFMADLQLQGGKKSFSCSSPESVQRKFRRLDDKVCVLCSEKHGLIACSKFKGLTPSGRLHELMKIPGMACFKCLKIKGTPGHPSIFRKCATICGVPNCGKPHHSLLHILKSKEEAVKANALSATVRVLAGARSKFSNNELETLLPAALAKIKYGKKNWLGLGLILFLKKSFVTKKVEVAPIFTT